MPYARNARRHRPSQIAEIAASIKEWGWTVPILIDEKDAIIAGHGRVLAAERLAIDDVPVVVARGWTDQQKRAYRLADNEIAMHAQWDTLLRVELKELRDQGVDLELMGFAAEDALVGGDDPNEGVPQALQPYPPREYCVIMCEDLVEWDRLKVALNPTPVRRGGYRKDLPLDDVGTQRVVKAADVLPRLETPAGYGDIHALDGPGYNPDREAVGAATTARRQGNPGQEPAASNVREGQSRRKNGSARRRAV